MSEEKVTSYELSKQLADAGFDSESHCGWYQEFQDIYNPTIKHGEWIEKSWTVPKKLRDAGWEISTYRDTDGELKQVGTILAYDCFDLLEFMEGTAYGDYWELRFDESGYVVCDRTRGFKDGDAPQEALGQAVLKVVQGE